MPNVIRRRIKIALLCVSFIVAIGPWAAFAQSGSAGGSIGNDEKSLSGSRSTEPERPARRSKPEAEESRRSAPRRSGGGGGGGNFDGAWAVSSVGTPCGSSSTAIVVTSGRIIGDGLVGTVSPSGGASSVGNSRQHHRDQFRPFFRPQRFRNVQAIGRLCRNVDGVEAVAPAPLYPAAAGLTDTNPSLN